MPGARDAPSLPVKGIGWVFIPESPTENEMKSWHSHQRTVGPQKWQFVVTITGGGVESLLHAWPWQKCPGAGREYAGCIEASFSFGIRQACLSCHVPSPDPPSASGVLRSPWTLPDKANGCFSSRSQARLPSPRPTPLPGIAAT